MLVVLLRVVVAEEEGDLEEVQRQKSGDRPSHYQECQAYLLLLH